MQFYGRARRLEFSLSGSLLVLIECLELPRTDELLHVAIVNVELSSIVKVLQCSKFAFEHGMCTTRTPIAAVHSFAANVTFGNSCREFLLERFVHYTLLE